MGNEQRIRTRPHWDRVISSEYSKNLSPVVKYVEECDGSVFVFANSKALTYKLLASLESKLKTISKTIDVIHVHGSLDNAQKYILINIFGRVITVPNLVPNFCIATSAADLGVNNKYVGLVFNFKWPDSIATVGLTISVSRPE